MAQQILDQLGVSASLQQDRGDGVAEAAQTDRRQPGPIQCDLESVRDEARILDQAAPVLKDQLAIDALPLFEQRLNRQVAETDHAPAAIGLGLDEDQTSAPLSLQRSPNLEPTGRQVDITPLEAKRLADSESFLAPPGSGACNTLPLTGLPVTLPVAGSSVSLEPALLHRILRSFRDQIRAGGPGGLQQTRPGDARALVPDSVKMVVRLVAAGRTRPRRRGRCRRW